MFSVFLPYTVAWGAWQRAVIAAIAERILNKSRLCLCYSQLDTFLSKPIHIYQQRSWPILHINIVSPIHESFATQWNIENWEVRQWERHFEIISNLCFKVWRAIFFGVVNWKLKIIISVKFLNSKRYISTISSEICFG